ncbi:MAG: flagellar biosynthesis anti-sigma factor FlgM [Desulfobacterales bacterium]|nr:flagellar biosynthesis anti-sigma factor FlgM [Desulfobacterales bacterium]MBF0398081.1 flagellar biosynthesis anti-sigma factor FlgM [Desulfobacterales bacterium]
MNIQNSLGKFARTNAYSNEAIQNKRTDTKDRLQSDKTISNQEKTGVIVNLSNSSKEMKVAMENTNNAQDVEARAKRVTDLKQSVQEGKYEVNPEKIAGKMLGSILNKFA